ncbi:hypothetical protein DPMN_098141 [Dreissena polymorpha]|uniref:Uncharacterized protein n=1 Tax=Dreissena polymorpha TaxID=45954 RepID=A0A9D4LD38_DREPO|nr:hypothetical protein DPMN_098141 [Dreissena polymorpha]
MEGTESESACEGLSEVDLFACANVEPKKGQPISLNLSNGDCAASVTIALVSNIAHQ